MLCCNLPKMTDGVSMPGIRGSRGGRDNLPLTTGHTTTGLCWAARKKRRLSADSHLSCLYYTTRLMGSDASVTNRSREGIYVLLCADESPMSHICCRRGMSE